MRLESMNFDEVVVYIGQIAERLQEKKCSTLLEP